MWRLAARTPSYLPYQVSQTEMGSRQLFPVQMELEGHRSSVMNRSCLQEPLLGPGLLGPGLQVQPLETKECPFHFFFFPCL